jgi:CBS domain-containing protein
MPPESADLAFALAAIDGAADEAALRAGFDDAVSAIRFAGRAGVGGPELAAGWSAVLRGCVASAARLVTTDQRWSWFVSGSVARGEAVAGSDVETLVVLAEDSGDGAALLARAAEAHELLERCGVRVDANGVLASRPRFCRTAQQWADGIARWSADPRQDRGVVMTGVLADTAAVYGPAASDVLRSEMVGAARVNYPARQYMLQDATSLRAAVPSRLKVLATQSDTVDIKLAAVDPVVKVARWAALSAGSTVISTPQRLDAAAESNILEAEDVSILQDCFSWLLRFRWDPSRDGEVIALSTLLPQQRATLRAVAREIAGISRKLTYLASTSAFR